MRALHLYVVVLCGGTFSVASPRYRNIPDHALALLLARLKERGIALGDETHEKGS